LLELLFLLDRSDHDDDNNVTVLDLGRRQQRLDKNKPLTKNAEEEEDDSSFRQRQL
jgi:hypothetical protein